MLLLEPIQALAEISLLPCSWKVITKFSPKTDKDIPVITLPGMMGADGSMATVRRFLTGLGYKCYGWGQGRNLGLHEDLEEELEAHVESIVHQTGQKVALIGHSLGGLYAREVAKRRPDLVFNVITLGSPFNQPEEAAISSIRMLYEILNGELTEKEHDMIRELKIAPNCPTHCIYSKQDRIVHYTSCLQDDPPDHVENIEVLGSHAGMGHNPWILYLIASRLVHA